MDKRTLANELWPFMRAKFDPGSGGSAAPIALVTPGSTTASKEFAYSGLGLSNTDDGTTYTLILTSTSNAVAASILASNAAGGLQLARLGVGVADGTNAMIDSLSTTLTQVRLSYDANNYTALRVGSVGTLTVAVTGITPANAHLYLIPGGNVGVGMNTAPSAKLEIVSITEQLRIGYSALAYAKFTVSSTGNLTLGTSGPNIYTTSHLAEPSYFSQLITWRISNAGEADFRYIYTDELHAKAFIADLEQALAGGQIVSKSVAKVAADLTLPAAGGNAYLYVEEFAGFAGFHVFEDGDLIRLRQFDRSGGGLKISDAWGTVVYVGQVISSNPPAQQYLFNRHPTYPGTGSGTIKTGVLAIDYGATGNGYTEQNAIDGLNGVNSPYYQIVTWDTHPKSVVAGQGLKLRVRLGQLRGLTGANQWGLYAGTGWTANPNEGNVSPYSVTTPPINNTHRYILAGDNGVQIYNADLVIYSGTTPVIVLDRISPYMAIGAGADTMSFLAGPSGYWVGNDSGTYKMRLGSVSGSVLTQGLSWDGSRLNIIGQINIGPSANYGVSVGNPLLMLRFDGDATGHKGQVATLTNAPFYDAQGKFGKAVVISDAVTNLCTNGDFESNTTGWSVVGTGASILRITGFGRFGASSLKLTAGGGGVAYAQNTITSSTSQKTFSAWVLPETAGTTAQIGNTGDGSSGAISLPLGVWTKIVYTVTPAAATRDWYIQTNAGKSIYIDGVQLESNSVSRAFTASASSQTGIAYAGSSIDATAGTFNAWVQVNNTTVTKALLGSDTNGAPFIGLTNTNQLQVTRKNLENVVGVASGVVAGTYAMVTVTWSGVTMKGYINGVLLQTASGVSGFVQPNNITIGTYDVGGSLSLNGAIDDVMISSSALSDDEIRAIYNSNKPVAINTDPYSLYLYGENGQGYVRGNATGLFGYSNITGAAGTGAFALVTTNGTSFDGQTMDAGDFMLGGVNSGLANLFFDRSLGRLVIRMGSVERIAMNETGAFGIKDSSGANNVLLFSSTAGNQILQRVDLYSSGSITAGPTFDDMVLDSTGLLLKSVTSFTDLNSIKWKYSSVLTGRITNVVNTGFKSSTTYVSASPVDGTWYSVLSLLAYNTTQINAALTLFSSGSGFYSLALNASSFTSLWGDTNVLSIFGDTPTHGNGVKVIFIANASTVPTTNPTGGGVLYASGGSLYWRTSSGNLRTIALV